MSYAIFVLLHMSLCKGQRTTNLKLILFLNGTSRSKCVKFHIDIAVPIWVT